jgi:hypothetical protein
VEVDETFIRGEEPGLRGGRANGKKVLSVIVVEIRPPRGWADVAWPHCPTRQQTTYGAY